MGKSKRPWNKFASIRRIELNNGDVKFETVFTGGGADAPYPATGKVFEDLSSAEAHLDAWWADWWPKQIKSSRRA